MFADVRGGPPTRIRGGEMFAPVAAILAAPTLITGYFGMNVPYAGSTAGVVVSSALAGGVPSGLYFSFGHRDWI
jgi:Mg2+ and Co2+ transporter CorA